MSLSTIVQLVQSCLVLSNLVRLVKFEISAGYITVSVLAGVLGGVVVCSVCSLYCSEAAAASLSQLAELLDTVS